MEKKSEIVVSNINAVETQRLRHRVLWPHIEQQRDCIIDIDTRQDSMHLGAFIDGQLVSVASFFEMTSEKLLEMKPSVGRQYRLRAMATDPDFRRKGAGKAVIQEAVQQLKKKGVSVLWCNARKVALDFYASLGFQMIDEWYDIPKIGPHKFMYIWLDN